MIDIAIIGAGPAGMTAAIYGKRAGLNVCVFEAELCGGQMIYTPEIENYPGTGKLSGAELASICASRCWSLVPSLLRMV